MGSDIDDELRRLQERAYGPDADIHDDPAALRRLGEIEALAARTGEDEVVIAAMPAIEADAVLPAELDVPVPDAQLSTGLSTRVGVAWAASVVIAVAATAGAAALLSSPALQHDAVLVALPASGRDIPEHLSESSASTVVEHTTFQGMRVFSGSVGDGTCIAFIPPPGPESDPDEREAFWTCSYVKPTIVDANVSPLGPLDPEVDYPVVRFTLVGDVVYADLSDIDPPA